MLAQPLEVLHKRLTIFKFHHVVDSPDIGIDKCACALAGSEWHGWALNYIASETCRCQPRSETAAHARPRPMLTQNEQLHGLQLTRQMRAFKAILRDFGSLWNPISQDGSMVGYIARAVATSVSTETVLGNLTWRPCLIRLGASLGNLACAPGPK